MSRPERISEELQFVIECAEDLWTAKEDYLTRQEEIGDGSYDPAEYEETIREAEANLQRVVNELIDSRVRAILHQHGLI
jgi:hypothetical protein